MAYTINFGQVESIVQDYYMPSIRDQYFLSNALYYRLASRKRIYSGGRSIVQPLSFAPEGGGGQWWSGVDKMDTRVRNVITSAQFFRKNFSLPVVLTRDEEDSVGGPTALMELVTAKLEIARPSAIDAIGVALFNDGADPKQIGGLQFALRNFTSGTITSHLYGGITNSPTNNAWWNHQVDGTGYIGGPVSQSVPGAGSFAQVAGYGPLGKMWSKIGRASGKRPTMILSNWGAYNDYHSALTVLERFTRPQQNTKLAEAGFENVMYKTAAWVIDERAPHGQTSTSAAADSTHAFENVYFVHEPACNLVIHSKRNMSWDNWREPIDQRVRVAYIDWSGEFVLSERRCNGVIQDVNVVSVS